MQIHTQADTKKKEARRRESQKEKLANTHPNTINPYIDPLGAEKSAANSHKMAGNLSDRKNARRSLHNQWACMNSEDDRLVSGDSIGAYGDYLGGNGGLPDSRIPAFGTPLARQEHQDSYG
jgi:hypothetical protein